jgi:hypothetical protein
MLPLKDSAAFGKVQMFYQAIAISGREANKQQRRRGDY